MLPRGASRCKFIVLIFMHSFWLIADELISLGYNFSVGAVELFCFNGALYSVQLMMTVTIYCDVEGR
jgi:hypothetical protein